MAPASQELQLRRAGVPRDHIYRDVGASGSTGTQERRGWHRLNGRLAGRDTLVVVAIDRIGRRWPDTIRSICELRDLGVKIRSLAETGVGIIGINPPKRHIFVDSFPFEEPNHREKPKKSRTPRRATTGKPKAKQKTNRKKATPQATPQPRTPKPRVEPTPAELEARDQNQREYNRNRNRTPERKELNRQIAQAKRQKAKSLGLCVGCGAPPSRTRPAVRHVPGNTGNTAGKPGREPSSRGSRHPDRPGSSEDNRPDPARGPIVQARGRSKSGRLTRPRTPTRKTGKGTGTPGYGPLGHLNLDLSLPRPDPEGTRTYSRRRCRTIHTCGPRLPQTAPVDMGNIDQISNPGR